MMKIILIALMSLTLANCSSTYKVKQEANMKDNRLLNEVPQWYIDASVDEGILFDRDAGKYIYSVGQGSSPDLQLAIEKATLIAKASLADQLDGELNKRANYFMTEDGKEGNKKVASKIDQTIVNIIKDTKVTGYEEWHKGVFETPQGTYRVYIGLKMGIGDFNRLAEYIVENADENVDVTKLAKEATDSLISVPVPEVTEVQ